MSLTVNNVAEGSFTKGDDVTLTVGYKLGAGSAGEIYDIDCGSDDKCKALGNVVLKFYLQPEQSEDERNHLAKIDELKAVFDKNRDDYYTLLTKWDGSSFSSLPTYVRLAEDKAKNKQAINDFVDSAIELTVADIRAYLHEYYIFHE